LELLNTSVSNEMETDDGGAKRFVWEQSIPCQSKAVTGAAGTTRNKGILVVAGYHNPGATTFEHNKSMTLFVDDLAAADPIELWGSSLRKVTLQDAAHPDKPAAIHMMTRTTPSGQLWIPPQLLRALRQQRELNDNGGKGTVHPQRKMLPLHSTRGARAVHRAHNNNTSRFARSVFNTYGTCARVPDQATPLYSHMSTERERERNPSPPNSVTAESRHQTIVFDDAKDAPVEDADPPPPLEQENLMVSDPTHQKRVRDDFRQTKMEIDKLQADKVVHVQVLWDSWQDAVDSFRGKRDLLSSMMIDWLTRRETALTRIEKCHDDCWEGNGAAFSQLPNHWPISGGLYRCRCEAHKARLLVCPRTKADSFRQLQFGTMRTDTQAVEARRDKDETLRAWRRMKDDFGSIMAGVLDDASHMWLLRRCDTLQSIEQCPRQCYFAQGDAWPALSPLFQCRCTPRTTDMPKKRKLVSDAEDSSGHTNRKAKLQGLRSAREVIDEMEAHESSTTEQLCAAWKHMSQRFWRMPGLEDNHDEYSWVYRRRLATVHIAYCIEFCWKKDPKAFFAHSGRILPGEMYRCTCPPVSLPPLTDGSHR
jgi:hypothetical protein